jgi:hypothetical protein
MRVTAISTVAGELLGATLLSLLISTTNTATAQITTDVAVDVADLSSGASTRFLSKTNPASQSTSGSQPTSSSRLRALRSLSQEASSLLTGEAKAKSLNGQVEYALRLVDALATLQKDPRLHSNGKLQQIRRSLTHRLRAIRKRAAAAERRFQRRPEKIEITQTVLAQLNQAANVPAGANVRAGANGPAGGNANNLVAQDYAPLLIDLIQRTISPQSWDVNGGASTIQYWRPGMALVVRAPGNVHEQLAPVLGQLRKQ